MPYPSGRSDRLFEPSRKTKCESKGVSEMKMSDDVKMRMVLYAGLTDDEESRLEVIDGDVVKLLLAELGITSGATWTSDDNNGHRRIVLNVAGPPSSTVFAMSAGELVSLSAPAL
jgi:hypothetical protein